MEAFGRSFLDEMKARFEIDLAGVTTIESARFPELEKRVHPLLPTARSVVVFAKEIYSEVVDLLRPSNEAGEAHGGDLLPVHSEYLNGRLNRGVHETGRTLPATRLSLPAPSRRRSNRPAFLGSPYLVQARRGARRHGKDRLAQPADHGGVWATGQARLPAH